MSDTAAEKKESPVASPEKEVVCERKPAKKEEATPKQENGNAKVEQNGDSKNGEKETSDEKEVKENGDSTDVCSLPQKRKSEVAATEDSPESAPTKDGASPEKKAKLEEKVENGEAEATA